MRGRPITKEEIGEIKSMRKIGHSLPEICRKLNRGSSTVYKYAKNVTVLPKYVLLLKQKRGGSKNKADASWKKAKLAAADLIKSIGKKEKLLVLAAIYWGEGTKKELNIINGDSMLIKVFVYCLRELGIKSDELRVSLRIYDNINSENAKKYWADVCEIDSRQILGIEILGGKKVGKLPYGMCRIRVTKSAECFKLIISMINILKEEIIKAPVVQRIE